MANRELKITHSFNNESGKVSPRDIYGPGKIVSDICIVTFSHKLMAKIIDEYPLEKVADIHATTGPASIYALSYHGKKPAFITH